MSKTWLNEKNTMIQWLHSVFQGKSKNAIALKDSSWKNYKIYG
jgi:hypothetical protein